MLTISKFFRSFSSITLAIIIIFTLSTNVNASEKEDYLPEGWTRIAQSALSDEEIAELKQSINNDKSGAMPIPSAPPLTKVEIIDLALDENDEIHVVVREKGTSKTRYVYWETQLCKENYNEMQLITDSSNIVTGYIRYFGTGIKYSNNVSGITVTTSAKYTNAMSPFNTLSTSKIFTLP